LKQTIGLASTSFRTRCSSEDAVSQLSRWTTKSLLDYCSGSHWSHWSAKLIAVNPLNDRMQHVLTIVKRYRSPVAEDDNLTENPGRRKWHSLRVCTRATKSKESKVSRKEGRLISFLFHARNYCKLSLCVIFSNTFDNLWKPWRPYARCSIKLRYDQIHKSWDSFFLNQRIILTCFMSLVASMLECFSILSVYVWLSLLISSYIRYIEIMM